MNHSHRSIDGVSRSRQPKAITTTTPRLPVTPAPTPAPRAHARPGIQQQPPRIKKRFPTWLQAVLSAPVIMIAPFLVQSAALGQIAIVIYGLAAFIWRVPSRTTFTIALLSMVTTIVLLVVKGDLALAQNFATYTFLLLVVGVSTLSRELKKEGGRVYSRRP